MTTNTKRPVPYAERLARESVKFGLRVGGSLLRHTPGLLKIGILGLPLALLGASGNRDEEEFGEAEADRSNEFEVRGDLVYDGHGELLSPLTEKELDDYNHGLI